jgi:hypothetical protein
MNTPEHDRIDSSTDDKLDEREWQAQERAVRAARLHLAGPDADPGYRRIANVLRQAPPVQLPADFARQLARRVGAATLDLRLERWLLRAVLLVLAVAVPVVLLRHAGAGAQVAAAVFPALSQSAPGWLLALLACVALNGLMEPLRRRIAAR